MRITDIAVNTKIQKKYIKNELKKPIYNDYRIKNENYTKTNYNWQ